MMHKLSILSELLTDGKISRLERMLGVSSSRLNKVVKRNSKINLDIVQSIIDKYPTINDKWFFNDDEPLFTSEDALREFIGKYIELNGHEKLDSLIKKLSEYNIYNYYLSELNTLGNNDSGNLGKEKYLEVRRSKKNNEIDNTAPLIPVKAQAGYTRAYDQAVYLDTMERYALPPGITRHGSTWAYWEIEGDSMEPTFRSGDIILTSQVHPIDWDDLKNFYVYVIVTGEKVYVKRVYVKSPEAWVMISDNEDNGYPQFIVDPKDVRQVWVFRRHISSRAPVSKQFEIKV